MHALRLTAGRLLTAASEIQQRAVNYTPMYSSDFTENEELFDSSCSGLPRVSEETNKELGGPLTTEEVLTALQSIRDLQDIKNWWPVSVLCADYKLLS